MTIEQAQKIIADLTLKHGAGDKYAPIIRWDEFEVITSALEAAEKRVAELDLIRAAAEKLVRCKGRYHSEQNYRALAALFGVTTPDLPPLDKESPSLTVAATDVLEERLRQISAEGWNSEHDDEHEPGQLSDAGGCYALNAYEKGKMHEDYEPDWWPWEHHWYKPSTPRRDLVKGAALILAEIERLDRAASIAIGE